MESTKDYLEELAELSKDSRGNFIFTLVPLLLVFQSFALPLQDELKSYSRALEKVEFSEVRGKFTLSKSIRTWLSKDLGPSGIQFHDSEAMEFVDFSSKETIKRINGKVASDTRYTIEDLLTEIPPGVDAIVTAAIYLEAKWQGHAVSLGPLPFNVLQPDQSVDLEVRNFFQLSQEALYKETDEYEKISVSLEDDKASLVLLLPKIGASGDFLKETTRIPSSRVIANLKLPKFQVRSSSKLLNYCREVLKCPLGQVVWKGMQFEISDVASQTFFSADEIGIKASGAAAFRMKQRGATPMVVSLTFDRPFYFSVIHPSGVPLFSGYVQDPQETE